MDARKNNFSRAPEFGCAINSIRTAQSVLNGACVLSIKNLANPCGDTRLLFVMFCSGCIYIGTLNGLYNYKR